MRKYLTTSLALAAVLLLATSGLALEKTSVQMLDDSHGNDWNAATTVTLAYYNFCQGWIWIWGGWSPGDLTGLCFENCQDGILSGSWLYTVTGAPSGYGFTGSVWVANADANCCVNGVLASQPWLPGSGWAFFTWSSIAVDPRFIIGQTWAAPTGFTALSRLASDHPAAGPTGVAACGVCYPTTRTTHSYYYGAAGATLCPGSVLNDGTCDIEWLNEAIVSCTISVEESTWGQIKALYQ